MLFDIPVDQSIFYLLIQVSLSLSFYLFLHMQDSITVQLGATLYLQLR